MNRSGTEMNLRAVTGGANASGTLPHAQLLADFAEALTLRREQETERLRSELQDKLGAEALVDVAATAAAFHGNVRVADATGTPPEKAAGGRITPEFREEVGINEYFNLTAH